MRLLKEDKFNFKTNSIYVFWGPDEENKGNKDGNKYKHFNDDKEYLARVVGAFLIEYGNPLDDNDYRMIEGFANKIRAVKLRGQG